MLRPSFEWFVFNVMIQPITALYVLMEFPKSHLVNFPNFDIRVNWEFFKLTPLQVCTEWNINNVKSERICYLTPLNQH